MGLVGAVQGLGNIGLAAINRGPDTTVKLIWQNVFLTYSILASQSFLTTGMIHVARVPRSTNFDI